MNYPKLKDGSRNWCATCKHNDDTECKFAEECSYQENADGTYNHDIKPTHYDDKPKTNYDLLISKTPEELARFITDDLCELFCGAPSVCDGDCEEKMLSWLKSPVEGVDNGT